MKKLKYLVILALTITTLLSTGISTAFADNGKTDWLNPTVIQNRFNQIQSIFHLSSNNQLNWGAFASGDSNVANTSVLPVDSVKGHSMGEKYAKEMIKKCFPQDDTSHLLPPIETPLTDQPKDITWAKTPTPRNSSNWCGYVAQWSQITYAQGTFNVRSVTSGGYDATWIGIGGFNGNGHLAQCGVDMVRMQAWYEYFPSAPVYMFNVSQGDIIGAVVNRTSDGTWVCCVWDQNNGRSFTWGAQFDPDQTTADWIVECPAGHTIGKFGTVNFQAQSVWCAPSFWPNGQVINSNNDSVLYRETLTVSGKTIIPGNIGSNGQSFSITAN